MNPTWSHRGRNPETKLQLAHQFDEVLGHAVVVLIDCMNDCVDEGLLVVVAQLCHVAKIDVGNAPVSQCKNVTCTSQEQALGRLDQDWGKERHSLSILDEQAHAPQ